MESNEFNNNKFFHWTQKLLRITQDKLTNKKLIDSCLVELNDLNYRDLVINNDMILLLVNQLIATIQPAETSLVRNTCQFLNNLFKNDVIFHGRTSAACKRWILEALEFSEPSAWLDILLTLQNFILAGIFTERQDLQMLLVNKGILKKVLNRKTLESVDCKAQGMDCLRAILHNNKNSKIPLTKEYVSTIVTITIDTVSSALADTANDQVQNKILYSCLRVFRILVADKLVLDEANFTGQLMGIIQALMFHEVQGYSPISPVFLRPLEINLPGHVHTFPKSGLWKISKGKLKKPSAKEACRYSSESESFDSEISTCSATKVRLETARLLQLMVENFPGREIFGFWPLIVASANKIDSRVLTRCILKEPSCKVKHSLLSALGELLTSGRDFLLNADDLEDDSSDNLFNTGEMLRILHQTLCLCLNSERNVMTLQQSLKCVSLLIQATPYSRLRPGLATKILRNVKPYLRHNDPTVRVAALSVYKSLACKDPLTSEIFEILARKDSTNPETEENNVPEILGIQQSEEVDLDDFKDTQNEDFIVEIPQEEKNMSFLLNMCLKNISNKAVSTPVRLQSLKVLGKLSLNAKSLIFPHMERIAKTLISLADEDETIFLHACQVLTDISSSFDSGRGEGIDHELVYWRTVFELFISLGQHSEPTLRITACNCLGVINSEMLAQFSVGTRGTHLKDIILRTSVRDAESAVRAAGLRALGMLVVLPTLEEDTGFLVDLVDAVCFSMDDQNLGVRVKAAWALANLCDCLVRRRDSEEMEPIPLDDVFPKIYDLSVKATRDNDKVKCNAVRSLGTILHLCPDRQIIKDTSSGLEALITCASSGNDMKVRWNACHALGLVLSQDPDKILPSSWREQVFPALCTLISYSSNFKVRTNAAWALSVCRSFGKQMASLWKSIVIAFDYAHHVPNCFEYPHRDALIQQLCLTLSHLAVCTNVSDLQNIWTEIGDYEKDIAGYMTNFQETAVPERLGDCVKAKGQFEKYSQSCGSSTERQIARNLASIFERNNPLNNLP